MTLNRSIASGSDLELGAGLSGLVGGPVVLGEEITEDRIRGVAQPDEGDESLSDDGGLLDVALGELTVEVPEGADLGPALAAVKQEEESADLVEQDPGRGLEQFELQLVQITDVSDGVDGVVGVRSDEEGIHPLGTEIVLLGLGESELLEMDNHEH